MVYLFTIIKRCLEPAGRDNFVHYSHDDSTPGHWKIVAHMLRRKSTGDN